VCVFLFRRTSPESRRFFPPHSLSQASVASRKPLFFFFGEPQRLALRASRRVSEAAALNHTPASSSAEDALP